jgi:hypothetical protein
MALAHTTDTRGLAVIAALGDPEGWPGLTAPAVTALGSYYTSHIHDSEQLSRQVSGVLFDLCFLRNPERDSFFKGSEHDEAHYLRLQPLCASLAEFVRNQPQLPGTAFLVNMAAAMELAPVAALAGPLHSWVLAFAERYDVGTLPDDVWGPLNSLIHEHKDNAQFASAFAPLIERRRQRYQAILADATAAVKPVPPPLTWWRRYLDFRWGSTFETRK